jgi:hypothetical protein
MHRLLFQESAGPQGEDLGEEGCEERKYYILHRSDSCGILGAQSWVGFGWADGRPQLDL